MSSLSHLGPSCGRPTEQQPFSLQPVAVSFRPRQQLGLVVFAQSLEHALAASDPQPKQYKSVYGNRLYCQEVEAASAKGKAALVQNSRSLPVLQLQVEDNAAHSYTSDNSLRTFLADLLQPKNASTAGEEESRAESQKSKSSKSSFSAESTGSLISRESKSRQPRRQIGFCVEGNSQPALTNLEDDLFSLSSDKGTDSGSQRDVIIYAGNSLLIEKRCPPIDEAKLRELTKVRPGPCYSGDDLYQHIYAKFQRKFYGQYNAKEVHEKAVDALALFRAGPPESHREGLANIASHTILFDGCDQKLNKAAIEKQNEANEADALKREALRALFASQIRFAGVRQSSQSRSQFSRSRSADVVEIRLDSSISASAANTGAKVEDLPSVFESDDKDGQILARKNSKGRPQKKGADALKHAVIGEWLEVSSHKSRNSLAHQPEHKISSGQKEAPKSRPMLRTTCSRGRSRNVNNSNARRSRCNGVKRINASAKDQKSCRTQLKTA